MKINQKEQLAAIKDLRATLKPGDTVFISLKHVSRSGMSRVLMPMVIRDNEPQYIGWEVATALGYSYDEDREGVKVSGCGTDMGFSLVYELGQTLFPDGFGVLGTYPDGSMRRPTTIAMAVKATASGAEFYGRNGDRLGWDFDGGYALQQRWL